jgi:hypothetical protein
VPTDSALLVAGAGPAPLDYEVPNAQEIIVLSARAVVDGSGAGAAFLPVVEFISDGDIILTQAITDATVAAGASAQVSWFPRVGSAAAAAAATGLPFASIALDDPATPLVAGTYAPNITAIHPNTPGAAIFTLDPLQPTYVQIAEAGVYGMAGYFSMSGPQTMTVGSFLSVTLGTTGLFTTLPRIVLELANTVATKRIQEATGVTFEQFAAADKARYVFATGQTFNNIGPLGWAIWQMSPSVTT